MIATLVATPFTIRLLNPAGYGVWALLQTSLAWAVLADVGMASASTKFGSNRYAVGDSLGESKVTWTALALTAVATSAVAVLVAIYAPTILDDFLHVHGALFGPSIVALRVVCGLFVVQAVAGTAKTPLVVRLQWRQYTMITTAASLAAAVGTPVAIALLAGGVVTAAWVAVITAALGALATWVVGVKLQPVLRRPHFDRAVLRQLLGYGGALTVSGLASIPLSTAERFFLAHNHTTAVVAYYAVAANLAAVISVLPQQLVGPLLPGLARLEAEGGTQEHRDLYGRSLMGLFLFLTPLTIMVGFVAQPFLSLWAGPVYGAHSTGPLLVLAGGVWLNCLAWVPFNYLLSSGRTRVIAYVHFAEVVPYIAAAYFMTERFGAIGAALVYAGRLAVDSIVFFLAVRRVAPQLPLSPLSDRHWRSGGAPLVLAAAALLLATVSQGLIGRVLIGTGLALVYAGAMWGLVLTRRERAALVGLAMEVVRRGPAPRHRKSTA
jgi:O-antigen/teichoic acid export membrane protein